MNEADALVILEAEREVQTIAILMSVAPLADIGRERLHYALEAISAALSLKRPEVGLRARVDG